MIRISASALVIVSVLTVSGHAQWLTYPTSGIPRTADGRPDLSAPAPVTADGKLDLSGLWIPDPGASGRTGIGPTVRSPYFENITADRKPEDVPFQPSIVPRDEGVAPSAGGAAPDRARFGSSVVVDRQHQPQRLAD
jgi:hypothetical protein